MILKYLMMVVVNYWFLAGVVGGYVLKTATGGFSISLVTGLVVGLAINELVKYLALS